MLKYTTIKEGYQIFSKSPLDRPEASWYSEVKGRKKVENRSETFPVWRFV